MSIISRFVFGVVSDWQDVLVRDGRMHLYPGAALSRTGLLGDDAGWSQQFRSIRASTCWANSNNGTNVLDQAAAR